MSFCLLIEFVVLEQPKTFGVTVGCHRFKRGCRISQNNVTHARIQISVSTWNYIGGGMETPDQ